MMEEIPPLAEMFAQHIDEITDEVTRAVIEQAGGTYASLDFAELRPRVLAGMEAFQRSLTEGTPGPFGAFFVRASVQRSQEGYDLEEMEKAIVATSDGIMPFVARHYAGTPPATLAENVRLAARIHLGGMEQIMTAFVKVHDEIVAAHTRELGRRVEQLDLINRVGRDATSLLDLHVLLPHIADLIRATFSYYAVMILLVDPEAKEVRLSAASAAEDVDLMQLDLRLPIDGHGIIPHVAITGMPLVVGDVSIEPRYRYIDALPRTCSEIALPLRIGDRVLGVLDLESAELNAFSPDDVQVLQTLADQLAIAIQNAGLYQAEAEARRAADAFRAEAVVASQMKSRFLASMSHELRTPLNAIINFTTFVARGMFGTVNAEQVSYLERVVAQGKHLLIIINDVLDLSKIEAGQMVLQCEALSPAVACRQAVEAVAGLARDKNLVLDNRVVNDLPAVWVDPIRLRQVLLNLLSNAIKFTPADGRITLCAEPASASASHLLVSVADTGIGIPVEHQAAIFQEFQQTEAGRREGGTGLGLTISSRIVALHGGRMWVESEVGRGSTFYFTLPLATT
jgi:signal transduction histidine kinase